MRFVYLAAVAAALTLPHFASADDDGLGDPLRLADVVAYARAHNPRLAAAQARADAAAFRPRQEGAIEDPTFSYEAWNIPNNWRIDRADNNILSLSQKLPFPGKRRLAAAVAEREADVARHETAGTALDVIVDAKRAYFDLWEAHQRLRIFERERDIAQRIAHVAERRYGTGEVTQSDVLRAQTELTRLVIQASTAGLAIDSARAELNVILSRPPDSPLAAPEFDEPEPAKDSVDDLIRSAIEHRPELEAQAAQIAREETASDLAVRNRLPDFEVSVRRFINYNQADGFGAMASVSIPLANLGKYSAARDEAAARLASARAERRDMENKVRGEVQKQLLRARTAELRFNLLVGTHIPQAEQSLRVTEAAYQVGTVTLLSLLDSVRVIEAAHLEHIEAAAELERAHADLERALASDLPKEGPQ